MCVCKSTLVVHTFFGIFVDSFVCSDELIRGGGRGIVRRDRVGEPL